MLRPATLGFAGTTVHSADVLYRANIQLDALVGAISDPVVLTNANGDVLTSVLHRQTTLTLRPSVGLPGGLEGAVTLPLVLSGVGFEEVSGAAFGDVGLGLKWAPGRFRLSWIEMAAFSEVLLPTGSPEQLAGDGTVGWRGGAILQRRLGKVLLALNGGAELRWHPPSYADVVVGQQALYGAVLDRPVRRSGGLHVFLEVHGARTFVSCSGGCPSEALIGIRARTGPMSWLVSGGAGLNDSLGAPAWRALLAVSYRFDRTDSDRDEISDSADACPDRPEDVDGYRDRDGCPDEDNDGDGVLDVLDRCPNAAEDRDGFDDADGCPEDDNDGDGIVDSSDDCPNSAEDIDHFQDQDGCPDLDNDGDGVNDTADQCPDAEETRNGFRDNDGCPDVPPPYVFQRGKPLVFNDILFESGKHEILLESFPVLDKIVESLQAQPEVYIRVEGHTDDRGDERANVTLSQQRALAVVNYLVGAGIDRRRLDYAGYGQTRPVAPNTDETSRRANRRVEIITIDRPELDRTVPP